MLFVRAEQCMVTKLFVMLNFAAKSYASDSIEELHVPPEGVKWWSPEYINTKYRDYFATKMHEMYENHFDPAMYDILNVRTQVGDEVVEYKMYGLKPTAQGSDIVTSSIRRSHSWESADNGYFQVRPRCQDTDSCGLFVDIGANIGYWSLFMAHLGYDVVSFEAMSSNNLMFYATLQDLVSPSIRDRVHVFPVALDNVTKDSPTKCIMCSVNYNTQDGSLVCGENPSCDSSKGYVEREKVAVFNLKYFLKDMFPAMFSNEGNRRVISNLKIDVEGHEPDVLYPILDLFQQGVIDKMFAECAFPRAAGFFSEQIGPRMKLLNPRELERCQTNIVNLKYERYPKPNSQIVERMSDSKDSVKETSSPIKELFDDVVKEKESGNDYMSIGRDGLVLIVLFVLLAVVLMKYGPSAFYRFMSSRRPHRD